jgi:pantetheine-phosphate adenylyltransferase
MRIAICPGSFDPVTVGHLDIIERAAKIFDRVIVAVLHNPRKHSWLGVEKRVSLIEKAAAFLPNVEVDSSRLLLAAYAEQKGAQVIVKGIRAMSDFELEFQMALINRKLNPALDTVFLTPSERFQYLSASAVREVGRLGGDISEFIPPAILEDVRAEMRKEKE